MSQVLLSLSEAAACLEDDLTSNEVNLGKNRLLVDSCNVAVELINGATLIIEYYSHLTR